MQGESNSIKNQEKICQGGFHPKDEIPPDQPEFTNVSYSFQTLQYMPVLIHQQIFHNIA